MLNLGPFSLISYFLSQKYGDKRNVVKWFPRHLRPCSGMLFGFFHRKDQLDDVIAEKDQLLADKDEEIAARQEELNQKEHAIQALENEISESNEYLAEIESTVDEVI